MKEFFEHLKLLIDNSGLFGNVELFNEQPDKTRKHQHKATKKRSVYVDFVVDETMNLTLGINDFVMTIRFIIANDNKKFSKLEDIDLLNSLNGVIQNQNNAVDDVYSFTSMIRTFSELDTDHDQISEPFIEYKTKLRDFSGYRYRGNTIGTLQNIEVTVEIEID